MLTYICRKADTECVKTGRAIRMRVRALLFILFGYLSGSVLYAKIWGKLLCGTDITQGSTDGNPGTANAFIQGGFWCGVLTLLCELLKGILPVYFYMRGMEPQALSDGWMALVIAAPVLGHTFPLFQKHHGGKGIAVSFGSLLGLYPYRMPVLVFAFVFIFFSVVVCVEPHFYRTIAAYLATLAGLFVTNVIPAVRYGFGMITILVCIRMKLSKEERERMRIKLLWMH